MAKMNAVARRQATNDVETAVKRMIAAGDPASLENSYREAKLSVELDKLVREHTLVNTSEACSQAIAAFCSKNNKKKRK